MLSVVEKIKPSHAVPERIVNGRFKRDLSLLKDSEGRRYVVLDLREVERRLKARGEE